MESCVGFIINKVTCPAAALKQIEERMRTIAAEELGELKEMFSTTRISPLCDSYQFSICHIPADFRQYFKSVLLKDQIIKVLSLKFANMDIKCAKEVKKDYFRIRSRLFCDAHKPNDSFIYVYSVRNKSKIICKLIFFNQEHRPQFASCHCGSFLQNKFFGKCFCSCTLNQN